VVGDCRSDAIALDKHGGRGRLGTVFAELVDQSLLDRATSEGHVVRE
jgi:hypothetical protein